MYEYWADVVNVHDGDTITVNIDLGFSTWRRNQRLRLAGISARELSKPGGPEARDYLQRLLQVGIGFGTRVTIRSLRDAADPSDVMSFDRYVVRVRDADGVDLAGRLVVAGYAVAWDGRTKPVPYPAWPIPAPSTPEGDR